MLRFYRKTLSLKLLQFSLILSARFYTCHYCCCFCCWRQFFRQRFPPACHAMPCHRYSRRVYILFLPLFTISSRASSWRSWLLLLQFVFLFIFAADYVLGGIDRCMVEFACAFVTANFWRLCWFARVKCLLSSCLAQSFSIPVGLVVILSTHKSLLSSIMGL